MLVKVQKPRHKCKMSQEQDDGSVAVLEKKTYISAPAITGSCLGFLNLSCFFLPKLHSFPTNHQQITSTQGFRQQCEKGNEVERSRWLRVMGCRFWGLKNRVREEITFRVKQLDLEKTTLDGYAVMHLQETLKPHLALKEKKTDEEQEQFRYDQEPQGEAPHKGINVNKWGLYEDVPRITGWKRDVLSSHYELVRPVLEPVPVFLTSDMEQAKECDPEAPELQNSRHSSKGDHLKKLWLDSDDDFAHHGRVIKECKSVVMQMSRTKGKEQGMVATLSDISSLVAMLDSRSSTFWTHSALLALRNLATGNDLNKAAIENAEAIPILVSQLVNPNSLTSTKAALLASFTTFDLINALIAVSGALPPLTNILKISRDVHIQSNALEVLYNLSHTECNTKTLVNTGATSNILNLVKNPLHCEKALAILANVITIPLGRRAMMNTEDGVEILVSILACSANLMCQERAVGLLMVMAHHSYGYRQAMVRKRAYPALLELSLLGSAVAQKQAMRILELLRDDREQKPAVWASVGSYIPYKANQQRFMIHTESS